MPRRDPSLSALLDLHGQVLVIDEAGYWVKFVVHRVPVSAEKPHGLDYSLTLHGPDGERLVGFDNAHPVGRGPGRAQDHRHRRHSLRRHDWEDAAALVASFWTEVEAVMREEGIWS